MIYDKVIIGAGASGLFHGALTSASKGLILEGSRRPGQKLLMSGNGQCNVTHGGSIKDFISHYGQHGTKIRSCLYKANNLSFMDFLTEGGISLTERPDGKVFPTSMKAEDILDFLVKAAEDNGYKIETGCKVHSIVAKENHLFTINGRIEARTVVIATGGCSYPGTGSDGSMFAVLKELGLDIIEPRAALTPVFVQNYPYGDLSGLSFEKVTASIGDHQTVDDLLFTHNNFSGPAVLNLSRYADTGLNLRISYVNQWPDAISVAGNHKQAGLFFSSALKLPKRFMEVVLNRASITPSTKVASLSGKEIKQIKSILMNDTFSISGTGGFKNSMVTKGGVNLNEIDLKTFESKKYPGLFIIGEALDIDGDTGGYNLQFCYSSSKSVK